jgi:hypothetical protein
MTVWDDLVREAGDLPEKPWPWDEPMDAAELEKYSWYEVQDQPEPWCNGHQHPCPGFYAKPPPVVLCSCSLRKEQDA